MIQAYNRLKQILDELPDQLEKISEEKASIKPAENKWSKKEILGHLVDSAANNHQRFVRMQIENKLNLLQYKQNEWVTIQNYQERKWIDIINLWKIYNEHILHIFSKVDLSKLTNTAMFPEYGEQTLQFLIDDYIDHMEHHIKQILSANG